MTQNEYMKNPQLEGDDFYWKGNEIAFLLIHGFTATTAEVRLMSEKLHEAGYTTTAPLLPGHGTHPDDLNQTTWQMWLSKVKETYKKLQRDGYNRIYVIGESMGSLLSIELAAQHPEIDGLILFSPGLKVKLIWLASILAPFIGIIKKFGKEDDLAWKGYNAYPVRAAVQLRKLQKHVMQQLPKIAQPTLVFTAEYDDTVLPETADIILGNVASKKKKYVHMEESTHCILLDRELDKAFNEVLAFIGEMDSVPG